MLQQLNKANKIGLKINLLETKVVTNIDDDKDIKIIERVDNNYVS